MKSRVSLFTLSVCVTLFFTSCLKTQGLKEPVLIKCTILGDDADCVAIDSGGSFDIKVEEMVGFICLSPTHTAMLENHHDALHVGLNQCLDREMRK